MHPSKNIYIFFVIEKCIFSHWLMCAVMLVCVLLWCHKFFFFLSKLMLGIKIMRRKIFINRVFFFVCIYVANMRVCVSYVYALSVCALKNIKHWFFSSLSCSTEEVNFFATRICVWGTVNISIGVLCLYTLYFMLAWPNFVVMLCECVLKKYIISFSSKCSRLRLLY